jgi:hypothetical protein
MSSSECESSIDEEEEYGSNITSSLEGKANFRTFCEDRIRGGDSRRPRRETSSSGGQRGLLNEEELIKTNDEGATISLNWSRGGHQDIMATEDLGKGGGRKVRITPMNLTNMRSEGDSSPEGWKGKEIQIGCGSGTVSEEEDREMEGVQEKWTGTSHTNGKGWPQALGASLTGRDVAAKILIGTVRPTEKEAVRPTEKEKGKGRPQALGASMEDRDVAAKIKLGIRGVRKDNEERGREQGQKSMGRDDVGWSERTKETNPEFWRKYFDKSFVGIREGKEIVLVEGKFNSPVEVRREATPCGRQSCKRWLDPGTEKFRTVCTMCYAQKKTQEEELERKSKQKQREAVEKKSRLEREQAREERKEEKRLERHRQALVQDSEQALIDHEMALLLQAEEDRAVEVSFHAGGREDRDGMDWTKVGARKGVASQSVGLFSRAEQITTQDNVGGRYSMLRDGEGESRKAGNREEAHRGDQSGYHTPTGGTQYFEMRGTKSESPLGRAVERQGGGGRKRYPGYEAFQALSELSPDDLEQIGILHILEPVGREGMQPIVQNVIGEMMEMQEQLTDIYTTQDTEMLLAAWQMTMRNILRCGHASDLFQAYTEGWVGELEKGVGGRKVRKLLESDSTFRAVVAHYWRYWGLLQERDRLAMKGEEVSAVIDEVESMGVPAADYRKQRQQAGAHLSADLLASLVISNYASPADLMKEAEEEGSEDSGMGDTRSSVLTARSKESVQVRKKKRSKEKAEQRKRADVMVQAQAQSSESVIQRRYADMHQTYLAAKEEKSARWGEEEGGHTGWSRGKAGGRSKKTSSRESSSSSGESSDGWGAAQSSARRSRTYVEGKPHKSRKAEEPRELPACKTQTELCYHILNTKGCEERLQEELAEKAKRWFDEYKGQMTQNKRELAATIVPRLHLSTEKVVTGVKPTARGYEGEGSVLDVVRMFSEMEDYVTMNHVSSWTLLMHAWRGELYEGRLKREMTAVITGKHQYLSLTPESSKIKAHQVVESALALYQYKIALIQKVPQIDSATTIWARLEEMELPQWGELSDWKAAYTAFRNEYARLPEGVRSGPDLWNKILMRCKKSSSSMAWIVSFEDWKGHMGKKEKDWSEDLLDQAVDAVHAAAEDGLVGLMAAWMREPPEKKNLGKPVGSRTIAAAGVTAQAGVGMLRESDDRPCHCNLRHLGMRNVKGCAFRIGRNVTTGEYALNSEYAGYNPIALAQISSVSGVGGVRTLMERHPDGEFAALSADVRKKFWMAYAGQKKLDAAEIHEMFRHVNVCTAQVQPVESMVRFADEGLSEEEVELVGLSKRMEMTQVEDETRNSSEEEASGDEEESGDEEKVPRSMMIYSMVYDATDGVIDGGAEAPSMVSAWFYQDGNKYLGEGLGKKNIIFIDGGSDVTSVGAEYCRKVGLTMTPRPREDWFTLDLAVEGHVSPHVCKHNVEVLVTFEGREFLGKDERLKTQLGEEGKRQMKISMPVVEGLAHQVVWGNDTISKYRVEDNKTDRLFSTLGDGEVTAITVKSMRLPEACDWVNRKGGGHARVVKRLACWMKLTKRVKQNRNRRTVAMSSVKIKDVPARGQVFVHLTAEAGTPVAERTVPTQNYHQSMITVTDMRNMPKLEIEGKVKERFTVLEQDVCVGQLGVWVRNNSEVPCTLPRSVIVARVTPIFSEGSLMWRERETEEETERAYSMARAAKKKEWEDEGNNMPTPGWIASELKSLWPLVHPDDRSRMTDEAIREQYTAERLVVIQDELMDKLDINGNKDTLATPWWEDGGGKEDKMMLGQVKEELEELRKGGRGEAIMKSRSTDGSGGTYAEGGYRSGETAEDGERGGEDRMSSISSEGERDDERDAPRISRVGLSRISRCTRGSQLGRYTNVGGRGGLWGKTSRREGVGVSSDGVVTRGGIGVNSGQIDKGDGMAIEEPGASVDRTVQDQHCHDSDDMDYQKGDTQAMGNQEAEVIRNNNKEIILSNEVADSENISGGQVVDGEDLDQARGDKGKIAGAL